MKVLFDTHIILDVLLEREPFAPLSAELVNRVETGEIAGILCATTLTTIDYLLGKALSKTQARTAIRTLLNLFQIAEVNKQILSQAADSDFADFEDAVQYCSGSSAAVDAIVTRNMADFKQAGCPVYSPLELLHVIEAR